MPELIFTPDALATKITNPRTNRRVMLGTLVSKYGKIKKKYVNDFELDENNIIVAKPLLAYNVDDNTIIKLMFDAPILAQPFQQIKPSKIKANTTIQNYNIIPSIPTDTPVQITFELEFMWIPNEGYEPKQREVRITGLFTPRQLSNENELKQIINPYFTSEWGIFDIRFNIILTQNEKTLELTDMELREQTPLKLNNIFNEIVSTEYNHCIHDYIKDLYPKYCKSEKQMKKISLFKNVNDIHQWAIERNFKMVAFDQSGTIIKSYYPTKKNKTKSMIFMVGHNHLYPIKNQYLHKTKPDMTRVNIVENVEELLINLINSGTAPKYVNLGGNSIDYFTVMDNKTEVIYSSNTEYNRCLEILNMFGVGDKIKPTTKIAQLGEIIEQNYSNRNSCDSNGITKVSKIMTQSFLPEIRNISKAGYTYINNDFEMDMTEESLQTIDKNKSYPYELYKLTHLPVVDMKKHIPKKITDQNHRIRPYYMYIVSVTESTIILPKNARYFGSTLIFAREHNIKFTLIEELETTLQPNYMKRMVKDLYSKYQTNIITRLEFKEIMNKFIGKFELHVEGYNRLNYIKVMNEDELKTFNGSIHRITDEYSLGYNTEEYYSIFSRNPIADLIKDNSRISVYKMMRKLNLKNTDIKQVKTDSITFKTISKNYENYINDELVGWKKETFRKMNKPSIENVETPTFFYSNNGNGTLITGYAGCGKTYDILNTIIPKLNKSKSYTVLTPSHTSLEEYRTNNISCDVIQKYTMANKIPDEDIIIVDEIGMIGSNMWSLLYKCKLAGKQIIAYGDFNQLSPVEDGLTFDNKNFLDLMFLRHKKNNNNHRNDFTHEYYDKLRDDRNRVEWKKIRDESIDKYNTPYEDAEIIIAYTNTTRNEYNKLMCDKLGITNEFDIGAKVICKTNKLRKFDIYNNFQFTVDYRDDHDIVLVSKHGIKYTLPIHTFNNKNYFDFGYCVTLYAVQGSSLNSFHYCLEDIRHLNGRGLYTLISRLKNK